MLGIPVSFKSDYKSLFSMGLRAYIALLMLILVIVSISQYSEGTFPHFEKLFEVGLIITSLFAFLVTVMFFLYHFLTTKVYLDGIKGYDHLGKYHFISWNEIEMVKFVTINSYSYLLIYSSKSKKAITVPTFIENLEDFKTLIIQRDNIKILSSFLEENPFEKTYNLTQKNDTSY